MDWEAKRRRRKDVADRAAYKDLMHSYCRVMGCGGTPAAAAGKGLDRLYCRKHADHRERHGSYFTPSYTAAQLAPYRKGAESWLRANKGDHAVQLSTRAIDGLYRRAGPFVEAFRLL